MGTPNKGARPPCPNFRPMFVVVKWMDRSKCHLVEVNIGPGDIVRRVPRYPPKGHSPQFLAGLLMPLGMEVGLGPGNIVLDGDPPPPKNGHSTPLFSPCQWPNGWMDQDAIWYGGRSQPRPHCVRYGPAPPESGTAPSLFSAHVYCGQTVAHLSYC